MNLEAGGTDTGVYSVAGTLHFSGGTRNLNTSSNITGAGTFAVAGATVNLLDSFGIAGTGNVQLNAGTLNLNTSGTSVSFANGLTMAGATLNATDEVVIPLGQTLTWSSGLIGGSGILTTSGTTTLTGGQLQGKTWNNTGTVNHSVSNLNLIGTAAVINNQSGANWNESVTGTVFSSGSSATFNNAGTLTVNSAGSSNFQPTFNNQPTGLINVSGTSIFNQTGGLTQAGTINVASGATFQRTGGFTNAGIIQGLGTVDVGAGNTLVNAGGTLHPGSNGVAGTLSIAGNIDLTGGTLAIDLGGTGVGQSDLLHVTGNMTMGGALNAGIIGLYVPANADAISFLTKGGTASGTFSALNLPASFSAGYNLAAGEGARLIYSLAGTRTFNNSLSNLDWGSAANWTGGLPGSADSALISGSFAVSHAYGTDTVGALTVESGNALNVSGGSLTVLGGMSLGGTLTVSAAGIAALNGTLNGASSGLLNLSGGTLSLGGASSLSGYTQTGGSVNGAGSLTVTNSFTHSAGNVGLTGSLDINHAGNLDLPAMTSLNSLLARATGSITLNGNIATAASGNSLVLAADGDFLNPGSYTLSPGSGRWLVYAASPGSINKGGLSSAFRHYGATHASYAPGSVAESGKGFIYASTAALTATAQHGTATHIYGDAPTAFSILLSGFADGEDNAGNIGLAGSATYSGSVSNLSNAGTVSVNYSSGLTSGAGYTFSGGTALTYNVTQRSLSVTANPQSMTYGNSVPVLTYTTGGLGLVNGDTLSGALATTASNTANVGSYAITQGSLAASGNYNLTTFTPNNISIGQRSLTLTTMGAVTKTYDGNTSVAVLPAPTFGNVVAGDNLNLSLSAGSGTYDTRHAGSGKTVSYIGLVLGGSAAGNYSLSGTTASGSGSITPLSSITWTGAGGDGNWSNAANWGGIIVDGGNVLNVNLAGNSVTYGAANGATSLNALSNVGGFTMAGGTLGIGSLLTTPAYVQTGGLLNGAGSLTVTQSFSKSGGTLGMAGLLSITQNSGNLVFSNGSALTLGAVTTVSGDIDITATGGITTTVPVAANGGVLKLTALSPINVGSGGLSATGNMTLSAMTPSPTSIIQLDGALAAGGSVILEAYAGIIQNAGISGQNIDLTTTTGNITVAATALSSVPAGGTINYSALAGTIVSIPANFAGATPTLSQLGVIGEAADAIEENTDTAVNEINSAVTRTDDALGDDLGGTLTDLPPADAESSSGQFRLASSTQTTGGEEGSFGGSEQTAAKGEENDAKKADDKKEERRTATKKAAQCS